MQQTSSSLPHVGVQAMAQVGAAPPRTADGHVRAAHPLSCSKRSGLPANLGGVRSLRADSRRHAALSAQTFSLLATQQVAHSRVSRALLVRPPVNLKVELSAPECTRLADQD